jgi:Tfp pilus assembly major pilin PilA
VVVAIIAVLAAIAIPRFSGYKLRTYKTELDADSKNVYTAAQAYLTDNPSATVDTIAKLTTGGYHRSENVVLDSSSISLSSGNVEIYSSTLNSQALDNKTVIFSNGRIEFANAP